VPERSFGHSELHGPGAGVEGPCPVTVAPVHPVRGALAVEGATRGVGLRGHEGLDERADHLPQQVDVGFLEVLAEPDDGVQSRFDHRVPPLRDPLPVLFEDEAVVFYFKNPNACRTPRPRTLGVFDGTKQSSVILGSANLTGRGLESNYEAGLWLRADPNDPLLDAAAQAFTLLWESPRALPLTEPIRKQYQAVQATRKAALAQVFQLAEYRRLAGELQRAISHALMRAGHSLANGD
jgi:hypothetical protein